MPSSTYPRGVATAVRRRGASKGDQREHAILTAARTMLEHKRLAAVTTDELAAGAGLSRSSFYFYFDSKTAVLTALLDELSTELREENGPWLDAVGPAREALRSATAHTVALWRTSGGLLRQAYGGDDEQLAQWRDAIVERGVRRMAEKVERDRAAGLAPLGPPSAVGIARMLHGAKTTLLLHRDPTTSHERLVEDIVTATLRLVYGIGSSAAGV